MGSFAGADRLVMVNRGSIIQPLPLVYRDRLARNPGVTQVTFATWFGGLYRDVRQSFPQFAIDRETYREMFPECVVSDDQWQAFLADREGAVVGEALAERFKWHVGDRVPIKGALFPGAWEFNIRGVYLRRRAPAVLPTTSERDRDRIDAGADGGTPGGNPPRARRI